MELHELIIARREALRWSQKNVADVAGTNQQTIDRIEKGSHSKYLNRVLAALGLDAEGNVTAESLQNQTQPNVPNDPDLVGARDLPVYAAVEGGPGEMVISTDAIDMVARPWFLERITKAYAIVVTGDSMDPVYEPGDIVLVNPKLPVIKGKDCIFTSEVHGGDFRASIKRYMGATESHWLAKQFNPPKGQKHELKFSRTEWHAAIRVVGKYVP